MKKEVIDFLNKRPDVIAAYGYGSGIIKQDGYSANDNPQLDLILVVDNLKRWHKENMKENKNDYSLIGKTYFKYASEKSLKGCTGITYLSNIKENSRTFKYGTIERLDLQNHLYYWDSFYMPGRFQKVVYPIKETDGLQEAIKINRKNALMIAAYILNKEYTTKTELLNTLCSLSYTGDTRMKFAENPNKVNNIVNASYDDLLRIYNFNNEYMKEKGIQHIEIDLDMIRYHSPMFPLALRNYLHYNINSKKILNYITKLNQKESIEQTLKGLKTNGVVRSVNYASKKLEKKFKH